MTDTKTAADYRTERFEHYRAMGEDFGTATAWANAEAADHYTAEANAAFARKNESFDRCEEDGFLTQWAAGKTGEVARLNAEIAANGGVAEVPALFDAVTGELVAAKLVQVYDRFKYSYVSKWIVLDGDNPYEAQATAWINAFPVRKSTMVKKGYTEGYVLAPAKGDTYAPPGATGLGGCTQVSVIVKRTDGGFSRNVKVVTTCRDYEKN